MQPCPRVRNRRYFVSPDYTKPNSHFPNPITPYTAHHLAPPNLSNTSRIEQLLRDGKLYLSMNDAVAWPWRTISTSLSSATT